MHSLNQSTVRRLMAVAALLCTAWTAQAQIQGTPPEITFIDFPAAIAIADGPRVGRVYFKDAERDVAQAEFSVVQAQQFDAFILDLAGAVRSDGVFQFFEFSIAPNAPQRVTLAVDLVDAQGLRSPARQFSFEITGSPATAAAGGRLDLEPATLRFEARAGGLAPNPQTVSVGHTAGADFSWTAQASVPWLQLTADQGRGPAQVEVSVTVAGLIPGVRLGQIVFRSPQAADVVVVTVALALLPAEVAAPSGQLVVLAFVALTFEAPADWVYELKDGCMVHTNVGAPASGLRVVRPDGQVDVFSVPLGNQIVICGQTVLIDTRS